MHDSGASVHGENKMANATLALKQVMALLEADPITARCRDFVVTLEGYVATDAQRRRAELDPWSLFAVDDAVNRIEVQS